MCQSTKLKLDKKKGEELSNPQTSKKIALLQTKNVHSHTNWPKYPHVS